MNHARFIIQRWESYQDKLLVALSTLMNSLRDRPLDLPASWQTHNLQAMCDLSARPELLPQVYGFLEAVGGLQIPNEKAVDLYAVLRRSIVAACTNSYLDERLSKLMFGKALAVYADHEQHIGGADLVMWSMTYGRITKYRAVPVYLNNLLISIPSTIKDLEDGTVDLIVHACIENLHSPSHTLRELSLRILASIFEEKCKVAVPAINTALTIETTPCDLESGRKISMYIRQLTSQFLSASPMPWLEEAIAHFCYGIYTYKLSSAWHEISAALDDLCKSKLVEDTLFKLAFQWLSEYKRPPKDPAVESDNQQRIPNDNFHCSNIEKIEEIFRRVEVLLGEPHSALHSSCDKSHVDCETIADNASSLALRMLSAVPHRAEKRSRKLVPIFLEQHSAAQGEHTNQDDLDLEEEIQEEATCGKLARNDQKALIDLFGRFINPLVLYRSGDVFEVLLSWLTIGDTEIQRAALKAIFTWKNPSIMPYQENLSNLVDDARFREELAIFVNVDGDSSNVEQAHREHLMPVLLRILYGKMTTRTGKGASNSQIVRKKAILQSLARFSDDEISMFLRIALGKLYDPSATGRNAQEYEDLYHQDLNIRKRLGLMNMIKELLTSLGSRLSAFTISLINGVLCCLVGSSRQLLCHSEIDSDDRGGKALNQSLLKEIRQTGLRCMKLLYMYCNYAKLEFAVPILFPEVIEPRLETLPIETAQTVSGVLQIFSTWSQHQDTMLLLQEPCPRVMTTLSSCLLEKSAKDDVLLFILDDIWGNLIEPPDTSENTKVDSITKRDSPHALILQSNIRPMLSAIDDILQHGPSNAVQASVIRILVGIASYIDESSQVKDIIGICVQLLRRPAQKVSPKVKGDILRILQQYTQNPTLQLSRPDIMNIYHAICPLFAYFRDRSNRMVLCDIVSSFQLVEKELSEIAGICHRLNAFASGKLDEPDFGTRLAAFHTINTALASSFTSLQWMPIIYNCLYFVREEDELPIRTSAGLVLNQFVQEHKGFIQRSDHLINAVMQEAILPAARQGACHDSEFVRAEYLSLMACIVRDNHDWEEVSDMHHLLVENDEEASFFANILHIQQHRRLRAMRRLATEAGKGIFSSKNVAHYFLPLLEKFIFEETEDERDHNLVAEAVNTIGALTSSLEWPQWRATLRRYTRYIAVKPGKERMIIKLLCLIIDALPSSTSIQADSCSEVGQAERARATLFRTMPGPSKLAEDVKSTLLPPLVKYLHGKDESTVSLRVPVAVAITKLVLLLDEAVQHQLLPPVLMDVTNILRSRAQESRDLTRKTLVELARLLGSKYFGFILKELRRSLQRGYQLHVLSFTTHSLLVGTSDQFRPGDLDYCLSDVVSIIIDDVFGITGQEKDAEDYISKMKEVKSSKSYDSLEHLAKTITINQASQLVRPLREILKGKLDLRASKKVDELLRRIMVGLSRNVDAQDRRVLIFTHQLIRSTYDGQDKRQEEYGEKSMTERFLINVESLDRMAWGHTAKCNTKFIKFSLELTRAVLQRHDELQTPANLSGFMPYISDAMVSQDEETQIAAARLLSTIIKLPLTELDVNAGLLVTQSVKIMRSCTSTNTELAQAALKLVSSILRERKQVEVREADIAYLLTRLVSDLEEPSRHGVAFNFVKAVLTRKIVIAEVYHVMDTVATLLVTNASRNTRDQARGLYLQFIMNYPQSKGRYSKQLAFLLKNLDYKHEDGRKSILEALHLLLSRLGDDLAQDLVEAAFVPLVMMMVNDEVSGCREMAAALVRSLLERADEDRQRAFLSLIKSWLSHTSSSSLVRIGLQVYGLCLDTAHTQAEKETPLVTLTIGKLLKASSLNFDTDDWELPYLALETFAKICHTFPEHALDAANSTIWASIRQSQALPHAWIKLSAAKLMGLLFADIARASASQEYTEPPLKGSGGLRLTSPEMSEMIRLSLRSLRNSNISEDLANQLMRNLVFLGKHMVEAEMAPIPGKTQEIAQSLDSKDMDVDDESMDDLENPQTSPHKKTAASYILSYASYILRRGPLSNTPPSLLPLHTSLRLLAALSRTLPMGALSPTITDILLPLQNLTDPSIPPPTSPDPTFTESYRSLVQNAQELMGFLQEKLGTSAYVQVLGEVRQNVKVRREERRVKRRLEAVNDGERMLKRKIRKVERGKEKRREQGTWEAGRRRGW